MLFMDNKILVSIVVPIYNVEKYIEKCLNSLKNQTYKNIEIILVDDGSTDNSNLICDKFAKNDSRFKYYKKENGGLSDARNYGIKLCNGEFLTFVDSDDYVDFDYVEYLLNLCLSTNTLMGVAQHRVIYDKKTIDFGDDYKKEEVLTGVNCLERMLYRDIIDTSAWGKIYHNSLFKDIKYPVGKYYEDIATTYKFFLAAKTVCIGYKSKYSYVYRTNSIVNRGFNIKKMELIEMTDMMANDVLNQIKGLDSAVMSRRAYARISVINQMIKVKNQKKNRKEMIYFIRKNKKALLNNGKILKKDKIAFRLVCFNYYIYAMAWIVFRHIKKGV